jgi:hypothetical protein
VIMLWCMMLMVVSTSTNPACWAAQGLRLTCLLDHFSMMCPPFAGAVGQIVAGAVARAVEDEAN